MTETIETVIARMKRCDFAPDELFSPDSIARDLGFWGVKVSRYDVLDVLFTMEQEGAARKVKNNIWTVRWV